LLLALNGQWIYYVVQADMSRARQVAGVMRDFGETGDDVAALETGCHMRGYVHMHCGELVEARAGLEQNLALFDPCRRRFYAGLSYDPLVALLANSSQLLVVLGDLDQALSRRKRALKEARGLSHPRDLAMAMSHGWLVRWCIRSKPNSLLQEA